MRVTVPGNVLLLGEYAVLEPGGLGLAMAAERRVAIETSRSDRLVIAGTWGRGSALWTGAEAPGTQPLMDEVVAACREWIQGRRPAADVPPVSVFVDSSALYRTGGTKAGYGSSAAVAVGLSAVLLAHAMEGEEAFSPDRMLPELASVALGAHRRAQGGRGSGYDVLTSVYGDLGLFAGGAEPKWQPLGLSWLPPLYLFPGEGSVSTPESIRRYEAWKKREPEAARAFLSASNSRVRRFSRSRSWAEAAGLFMLCAEEGRRLGELIGVPADVQPPDRPGEAWIKALGAGNELGVCISRGPLPAPSYERVARASRGVQWEA